MLISDDFQSFRKWLSWIFGGLDNSMYFKNIFGEFHWNYFLLGGYIWLNVNLTLHLIWPNVKLALSQILGVFILYINTQVSFCQMASQLQLASQPAIWQNVNLIQSQMVREGQVDILWDGQSANQPVSQFQFASHLTKCQPDSQSYLCVWRVIWPSQISPNVNLTQSLMLGGGKFDQISTWLKVWPNVYLTWSCILGDKTSDHMLTWLEV